MGTTAPLLESVSSGQSKVKDREGSVDALCGCAPPPLPELLQIESVLEAKCRELVIAIAVLSLENGVS